MLRALLAAVSLAATCVLLTPGPAGAVSYPAQCGTLHRVPTRKHLNPGKQDPLIVGDSVLLGAIPQVSAIGFDIDTQGCRGWDDGAHVLRVARSRGRLPHMVVMMLGTNYGISLGQIRSTLITLGRDRVLVLLTPREVGGAGGSDAVAVRAAGRRWPKQVVVLDWVRYTAGKNSWFQPDGIHLMPGGAHALARILKPVRRYASPGVMPAPASRAAAARDGAAVAKPARPSYSCLCNYFRSTDQEAAHAA